MKEQKIREFIRKSISEMSELDESDLIAKDQGQWERMKGDFKSNVVTLIQNIEDDQYEDAKDTIGETIAMLKFWRGKIKKGLSSTGSEDYDLDRFELGQTPGVIDEY